MLVRGVENVAYDELGEIELATARSRRCKVLEINGNDALVQLFESSTGINLSNSKVRFLGRSMELGVSEDMLGRVFTDWAAHRRRTGDPAGERSDINGLPMNPAARNYPQSSSRRCLRHRRTEHPGRGQKLPIFSASGLPHANAGGTDRPQAKVRGTTSSSPLSLPPWVSPLRSRTSSSRASRRPAPSTAPSCSSTWQTTRPSSVSPPPYGSDRRRVSGL